MDVQNPNANANAAPSFQPTFQPTPAQQQTSQSNFTAPTPVAPVIKNEIKTATEPAKKWSLIDGVFSFFVWFLLLIIAFLMYFQQFDLFDIVFDEIRFASMPLIVLAWSLLLLRKTKLWRAMGALFALAGIGLSVMMVVSFEKPQHTAPYTLRHESEVESFVVRAFMTDIEIGQSETSFFEGIAEGTNDWSSDTQWYTKWDTHVTHMRWEESGELRATKDMVWSLQAKIPEVNDISLYNVYGAKDVTLGRVSRVDIAWVYGDTRLVITDSVDKINVDAGYGNIEIVLPEDMSAQVTHTQHAMPFSSPETYTVWNGERVVVINAAQFGGSLLISFGDGMTQDIVSEETTEVWDVTPLEDEENTVSGE